MNAILLEQTASHLKRQVRRWDRRLRLVESIIWVPRALIVAVAFGIVIALLSRMRPWLLPEQVAWISGILALITSLGALGLVWFWPQSIAGQARYFDLRFELKERISTALELTGGIIPLSGRLAEHQLNDAVRVVKTVKPAERLPVRIRWWELGLLVALAALLVYLLITENPQANELLARREMEDAINTQISEIEEIQQDIQSSASLSEAEKEALTQPLDEALEILQQPDISQQEAVAALAEAGQALSELSEGMLPEQQEAYQAAASELAGSEETSDLAQSLYQPDLKAAADALNQLANDLGEAEFSEEELEDLAERLEQTAEAMEAVNPAVAEKLREASEALRDGDIQAAQEALKEAAQMMREQQQQLENSPLAESATAAQQRIDQGQQELSQVGQPEQQSNQSQQTPGESQNSQQGNQSQSQQQPGESQSQSSSAEGASEQTGEISEQPAGQVPETAPGESGQGQSSETGEEGQAGDDSGAGQSQQSGQAESQMSQSASVPGSEQTQGGVSALGAGVGEGGQGVDTTTGLPSEQAEGQISTNNAPGSGEGEIQAYESGYAPEVIGGASSQVLDVTGDQPPEGGEPVLEGEFGPNPEGEAALSYTGVYQNYQGAISEALDSGRIPLDQRDVIHDYFAFLEP